MLGWLGGKGPWVLVAGILAGLTLPGLARLLVPYIPHMVAGLLFLSALRIGPEQMRVSLKGRIGQSVGLLLLAQLVFPLCLIALLWGVGWLNSPFAQALVLIAMSSSIAGAPNMMAMMGFDLAASMRLLLMGTAILPVTVLPILWLMPSFGDLGQVILAALRLLVVIVMSGGLAFLIRRFLWQEISTKELRSIDGASALLLAVVVVGLMSAVNAALIHDPAKFWSWLAFVLVINFGLQTVSFLVVRRRYAPDLAAALTVLAGNRNIALFLVALPEPVMAPLLVFVGCYQIPMYLTPLVTGRMLKGLDRTST